MACCCSARVRDTAVTDIKTCARRRAQQVTEGVGKLLRSLGELPNLLDVDLSDNGLFGARWDKYSLAWVGTLCHEVRGHEWSPFAP